MKKFLSILTVLLFVFSFSANFVNAVGPSAGLTNVAGGITSITGTPSTSGTESGVHTITISDATASTIVSNDIEDNGAVDTIAVTIDGTNDDITVIIAGKTLVFDLAAATAGVTTLSAVAADLQTKINAALIAQDMPVTVAVTVTGASPDKTLLITVGKAGLSNTITSINGGGATALTFLNAPVASTDAKAVDVFVAATGSNGVWVVANGGTTKTISHTTAPGTASTLAGLKTLITAANAFINGITLVAAGDVIAGAPAITVTAGGAHHFKVAAASATPEAGATNEITVTAYDEADNRATSYTGAKTLIFSGLSAATTGEIATVEAVELGSDTAITFTSGVSNGGAATLIAYKAETASLDVAEKTSGTIASTGNASYNADLIVAPKSTGGKLVFAVQPSTVNYRAQNFLTQPQVRIQDEYENNRTDGGVSIVLVEKSVAGCAGLEDPAGTLTGTPKNTASGLATFTAVQFDTTSGGATYYLKATSAGLTTACSNGFIVVSGSETTPQIIATSGTTPTTTAPAQTTTTTTTPAPAVTSMPQPVKPIAQMNQAEKNTYVMQLQTFLIQLLTQLLNLMKK